MEQIKKYGSMNRCQFPIVKTNLVFAQIHVPGSKVAVRIGYWYFHILHQFAEKVRTFFQSFDDLSTKLIILNLQH